MLNWHVSALILVTPHPQDMFASLKSHPKLKELVDNIQVGGGLRGAGLIKQRACLRALRACLGLGPRVQGVQA